MNPDDVTVTLVSSSRVTRGDVNHRNDAQPRVRRSAVPLRMDTRPSMLSSKDTPNAGGANPKLPSQMFASDVVTLSENDESVNVDDASIPPRNANPRLSAPQ